MAERGVDGKSLTQIFLNGFRLGWRFDDDKTFGQCFLYLPLLDLKLARIQAAAQNGDPGPSAISCQLSVLTFRISDDNIRFTSTTCASRR
jgi:hypothetical protein